MQEDMHFYGTYAIARAAGIPPEESKIIAYAAQFVDDSTKADSESHEDGGLLYGIATAHHSMQAVKNSVADPEEQRRVWVPFHFIPGGEGETFEEKLLCVQDSPIANKMIEHHIKYAKEDTSFGLELLGIGAHVYMDTFSHYGFSGISSKYNSVDGDAIEFLTEFKENRFGDNLKEKAIRFGETYPQEFRLFRSFISGAAEFLTGSLGHGGVATYPDRPYLHWKVSFELDQPNDQKISDRSDRNNPVTFLEGCEKLHGHLSKYAEHKGYVPVPFGEIKEKVSEILNFQGWCEERSKKWRQAMATGPNSLDFSDPSPKDAAVKYNKEEWENEKLNFHNLPSSSEATKTHSYRFHQAAAIHRYYLLKDLLPENGIVVY